jgi:ABC-type nitrate/sulfonate/bicarbonate transport system substrate-binding protein
MHNRVFRDLLKLTCMEKLLLRITILWFCCSGQVLAAPLRLSYSVVGPSVAGVWMAYETGTFKKYGLDVQLIYIPSSGMNIQALLGSSLDVSTPGISGVVLAAARGAPVLAIAAMTNRPAMTLYVQPEITRADQLKGQTLGISRFNSSGHTVTTLILRKLGLEKSTTMRPLGGTPEMQAAFEQKQIAGIVTGVKPGAPSRALLNAFDMDIPFAMNVMAVTREFLQKNPDTVERVIKAYIEAVGAMKITTKKPHSRCWPNISTGVIPIFSMKRIVSSPSSPRRHRESILEMWLRSWSSNPSKASTLKRLPPKSSITAWSINS